jgi:oxygen-independent coproporphyrinogen III oxidase
MILTKTLFQNPYAGYAYSYPHKHAYRKFEQPISLNELWQNEPKDALFLYVHIPFCEMRCGFCNLFTVANPKGNLEERYLKALEIQAKIVKNAIADCKFTRIAVGGGTPTFLELPALEQLCTIIQSTMQADTQTTPFSFEMSPKTITPEKLQFLKQNGVDRVSIGIQSFIEKEQKALGRPQKNKTVFDALSMIRAVDFESLNLDLIYGTYGQTVESWLFSLQAAMHYKPEEIFIYPLYSRPLTGIEKMSKNDTDIRFELYQAAKDFLLDNGYEQISMRMFRLKSKFTHNDAPLYCCQEDGMVGLGAGARSYTKSVHYSSEYAVGSKNVKDIIQNFIEKTPFDYNLADYGIQLTESELKLRYVIKSILHASGLNLAQYRRFFKSEALDEQPKLRYLLESDLCFVENDSVVKLTSQGIDLSDAIGPWLYSETIQSKIKQFELK